MATDMTGSGFPESDDDDVESTTSVRLEHERGDMLGTDEEGVSSQSEDDTFAAQNEDFLVANIRGRRNRVGPRRRHVEQDIGTMIATVQLANEVEGLRRRRDELISLRVGRLLNFSRRDFLATTAIEYFDRFSNGLVAPRLPAIYHYLNTRVDPELFAYGMTGFGVETWIEQWHRYMRIFPSIAIRIRTTSTTNLVDPHDIASMAEADASTTTSIVEAHGTMTGIISRQAIDTLLPHLRHREDLVHKLLGQPLDCPMTLRFYFNGHGRIIRLDFDADFFQAFSNVADVGLFEVMHMMEQVMVTECSVIPEVVDDENDASEDHGDQEECS